MIDGLITATIFFFAISIPHWLPRLLDWLDGPIQTAKRYGYKRKDFYDH